MHVQKSGALPRLVAIISVMIALMLGTSLSIANANTDEGVEETPIVATATATAEITGDPVIEVPEDEGAEEPETNAPAPPATTTTEITDDPVIEAPEDEGAEEPAEEQTPPMNQFVDVVVGECQVAITQKMGVDWTEVIADNGDPSHWGITKGKPTLVVKPVDPTKDLVVRIIPVISLEEAWEYSVTLEASASCGDPGPTPTPTPTGEPTRPDPSDLVGALQQECTVGGALGEGRAGVIFSQGIDLVASVYLLNEAGEVVEAFTLAKGDTAIIDIRRFDAVTFDVVWGNWSEPVKTEGDIITCLDPTPTPEPTPTKKPTEKPTPDKGKDEKSDDRAGVPKTGVTDDGGSAWALTSLVAIMAAVAAAVAAHKRKEN